MASQLSNWASTLASAKLRLKTIYGRLGRGGTLEVSAQKPFLGLFCQFADFFQAEKNPVDKAKNYAIMHH